MKLLATSGNADHGTARQATTVQRAKRVWSFARKAKELNTPEAWKVVERLAAIGMPQTFKVQLASYIVGFRRPRGSVECRGQRSRSAHAHTRTLSHTHTHTHAHTLAHAQAHACTHTHTHAHTRTSPIAEVAESWKIKF